MAAAIPSAPFFFPIVLNRAIPCDSCGIGLEVGDRAHLSWERRAELGWTCLCHSCRSDGRLVVYRPFDHLVSRARDSIASLTTTAKRVLHTTSVAIRGAFRWLFAERKARPAVVREAFEELGTTYLKLGQLVASSHGLFPEHYCQELRACLDRAPAFPFEQVKHTIEAELGGDLFAEIEEAPIASASIAQVHAARLKSGEHVVIKVQRPGLTPILGADLTMLRFFARQLARRRDTEMANPVGIVEDFADNLAEEIDFTREAESMDEFNRIMAKHGHTDVVAPRTLFARRRVLVMERFRGTRVDDVANIRDGEDKLLAGMRAWFRGLVFHGFFHGDVHAGNLMALDDGRIGFLDFGIVGRFNPAQRTLITDYLLAFALGDFERVVDVMIAMGTAAETVDRAELARDLKTSFEPMLAGNDVKYSDMLPAMLRTSVRHGLRLPREMVLVSKQMIYFDRYARVLAPNLNVFRDPRVVMALAQDVAAARLSDAG
jgi:aarF domain-containing kinase